MRGCTKCHHATVAEELVYNAAMLRHDIADNSKESILELDDLFGTYRCGKTCEIANINKHDCDSHSFTFYLSIILQKFFCHLN